MTKTNRREMLKLSSAVAVGSTGLLSGVGAAAKDGSGLHGSPVPDLRLLNNTQADRTLDVSVVETNSGSTVFEKTVELGSVVGDGNSLEIPLPIATSGEFTIRVTDEDGTTAEMNTKTPSRGLPETTGYMFEVKPNDTLDVMRVMV